MIKWLKDSNAHPRNLVLAGGLFGLSTLVRTNPWFLLPASGLAIILRMRFAIKPTIYHSMLFGAAALASILPWMVRSQMTIDTPLYFLYKMQHSVVEERYERISPDESEPNYKDNSPIRIQTTQEPRLVAYPTSQ